jgi:hypothetical protein
MLQALVASQLLIQRLRIQMVMSGTRTATVTPLAAPADGRFLQGLCR